MRADIAWAAGLFEGEGCFYLGNGQSGGKYARAPLSSTDQDVVKHFHRVVGVGTIGPARKTRTGRKLQYRWRCSKLDEVREVAILL